MGWMGCTGEEGDGRATTVTSVTTSTHLDRRKSRKPCRQCTLGKMRIGHNVPVQSLKHIGLCTSLNESFETVPIMVCCLLDSKDVSLQK